MSYPKYLMEIHLGRYLSLDETIDHIDKDPLNNDLSNLRILDRHEHTRVDSKRRLDQSFECPICGTKFILNRKQLSWRISEQKKRQCDIAGPFCSHRCSAIYSNQLRAGHRDKLSGAVIADPCVHKK